MSERKGQVTTWTALTNVASFELKFNWTISNFSKVEILCGECLFSPDFGGPTKFPGIRCKAHGCVFPRGQSSKFKDYLSVYLFLEVNPENTAFEIMARYEISILGYHGQKLKSKTTKLNVYDTSWGYSNYIRLSEFEKRGDKLLPGGNLTLYYEGEIWITFVNKDLTRKTFPNPIVGMNITSNLFETGNGSDVVIKAGCREFMCHKAVLSFRSEYFRAMFDREPNKENQMEVVDLSNQMDGNVLKDLLEFLYLGKAGNLNQTCHKMIKIAQMFLLDDLKSQSEETLIDQLNPSNSWEIAMLAREFGSKKLQKEALVFLAESL